MHSLITTLTVAILVSEMLPKLWDGRDYRWAHLEPDKPLHTKT